MLYMVQFLQTFSSDIIFHICYYRLACKVLLLDSIFQFGRLLICAMATYLTVLFNCSQYRVRAQSNVNNVKSTGKSVAIIIT